MIDIPYTEKTTYPQYYFGKICAIIPCKNRAEHLRISLKHWLRQTFRRLEIIVVDYSSKEPCLWAVQEAAAEVGESVDTGPVDLNQRYTNYPKISYMRLEELDVWNISHAINYAVVRSTSDVITVAGCDSLPEPLYVDTVMHLVNDKTIPSIICGRMTYPRKLWHEINGYQEICTEWGYEDVDFRHRLRRTGANTLEINSNLCPSIQHTGRILKQETNKALCDEYYAQYGYIANYCSPCGKLKPIQINEPKNINCIYFTKIEQQVNNICNTIAYAGQLNNTAFYIVPIEGDTGNRFSFECSNINRITTSASIWSLFNILKSEEQLYQIINDPNKLKEIESEPINFVVN